MNKTFKPRELPWTVYILGQKMNSFCIQNISISEPNLFVYIFHLLYTLYIFKKNSDKQVPVPDHFRFLLKKTTTENTCPTTIYYYTTTHDC